LINVSFPFVVQRNIFLPLFYDLYSTPRVRPFPNNILFGNLSFLPLAFNYVPVDYASVLFNSSWRRTTPARVSSPFSYATGPLNFKHSVSRKFFSPQKDHSSRVFSPYVYQKYARRLLPRQCFSDLGIAPPTFPSSLSDLSPYSKRLIFLSS